MISGDSVVDSMLRVHGVERLRVVDASVFPTVTSANTNAPTLMVAQKSGRINTQRRITRDREGSDETRQYQGFRGGQSAAGLRRTLFRIPEVEDLVRHRRRGAKYTQPPSDLMSSLR